MGVNTQAVWVGLGVSSDHCSEACPNGQIWLMGLDLSKAGKVWAKKGLPKVQPFSLEWSGLTSPVLLPTVEEAVRIRTVASRLGVHRG